MHFTCVAHAPHFRATFYQASPHFRTVREGLSDVVSIHSSQFNLICNPKIAPVVVLHTQAKVLLLSENGTVGSA